MRATNQAMPVATTPPSPPRSVLPPLREVFTIELAAYMAIVILSLAIRIGHLDAYPLDPAEATRALSGWQLGRGEIPMSWQEPLVILSAALSILALGDNDVIVRLAPALIGSGLVVLPWLLRPQIGRWGALLASLFLSISPSFVFYSRTLSGDIFAAALSLGLLSCILQYVAKRQAHWAVVGGALFALLLNSGAPGVSFLLPFVAFFSLMSALGKIPYDYVQSWESFKADRDALKQTGIVLVGGFVLVSTSFLGNLSGLKLPGLSAWVAEFNLVADGRPWYYHLALLIGYEPLILLLGVAAGIYYLYLWHKPETRRALGIKSFLMFWALVSFVAASFTGAKYGGQLLGPVLPLALLAGCIVGELGDGIKVRLSTTGQWLLAGSMPFLVYALLVVSEATQKDAAVFWFQWMLALLALGLVAILVVASVAYEGQRAGRFAAIVGVALLIGYSVHATWRTAYATSEGELLASTLTSPSLTSVGDEIGELAASKFLGEKMAVAVEPDLRIPVEWYLRRYASVQFTPKPAPEAQAIIWQVDPPPDINLRDYFARRAVVTTSWRAKDGGLGKMWRWLIYREPFGETQTEQMMLYLHD